MTCLELAPFGEAAEDGKRSDAREGCAKDAAEGYGDVRRLPVQKVQCAWIVKLYFVWTCCRELLEGEMSTGGSEVAQCWGLA